MDEFKENAVCEKEIGRAIAMDEFKENAVCKKEIGMHGDPLGFQTALVHASSPLSLSRRELEKLAGSSVYDCWRPMLGKKTASPIKFEKFAGSSKVVLREGMLCRNTTSPKNNVVRVDWLSLGPEAKDWTLEREVETARLKEEKREQETVRAQIKEIIMLAIPIGSRPIGSLVQGVLVDLTPVTEKRLQSSDLDKRQNRILIPIADVRKNLLPFLSHEEQRDANLLGLTTKKRKREQTEAGREHGGLEVRLITEIMEVREIGMMLTQWDGTLGVVLKGGAEWKGIVTVQKLQKGDSVELLVFRRSATTVKRPGPTTELCFVLRTNSCSRGGNTAAVEPAPEAKQMINFFGSERLD